jgi:hypothetical protein
VHLNKWDVAYRCTGNELVLSFIAGWRQQMLHQFACHNLTFAETPDSWSMTNGNANTVACSEGQEKYLRVLSITPVGYFTGAIKNHSRAVSHRNYFVWQNEVFQRMNDFPNVSFTLDVI